MKWQTSANLVPYEEAIQDMEAYVPHILEKAAPERIWLLEHPALYTLGTSTKPEDLLDKTSLPVFETGRGGRSTYHGPGQRVVYVQIDLKKHKLGPKEYVKKLEEWIIRALAEFGLHGEIHPDQIGVWVKDPSGKRVKIAAIGVRVKKWVTLHGLALNVSPDLSHFKGIVPCGIQDYGVTSLKELGIDTTLEEVDAVLKKTFIPFS